MPKHSIYQEENNIYDSEDEESGCCEICLCVFCTYCCLYLTCN